MPNIAQRSVAGGLDVSVQGKIAPIADGDYRAAGKTGIQTLLIAVATAITLGEGAAALAGGKGAGTAAIGNAENAALKKAAKEGVASNTTTLKPGPYAVESIPAHRGRPTAVEQRQVNALMEKHGCHTCGTKDPGTKSGNAIADHHPPQALGEPKEFFPHCNNCKARQGGEVLQELRKMQGQ